MGEITRVLNGTSGLWQEADVRFGRRIDYRIWRVFFSKSSTAYSTTVNYREILEQLKSRQFEIVWGLIVLLSSLFNNKDGKAVFSPEEWSRLFETANIVLSNGLNPIQGGEFSCYLADFLMTGTIQQFRWETRNKEITCGEAMSFLNTLAAILKNIDPGWTLGGSLTTRRIRKDSKPIFSFEPVAGISLIPQRLYYASAYLQ